MMHINLKNDLVSRVRVETLKNLNNDPAEFFYMPGSPLKNSIAFLYQENIVGTLDLIVSLLTAVWDQALKDYEHLMAIGRDMYPDRAPAPELMLHAIKAEILTEEAAKIMPFDPGNKTYVSENLIGEVLELLKETKLERPYHVCEGTPALMDQVAARRLL